MLLLLSNSDGQFDAQRTVERSREKAQVKGLGTSHNRESQDLKRTNLGNETQSQEQRKESNKRCGLGFRGSIPFPITKVVS